MPDLTPDLPSSARSALREAAEAVQVASAGVEAMRSKSISGYHAAQLVERNALKALHYRCRPDTILALLSLAERGAEPTLAGVCAACGAGVSVVSGPVNNIVCHNVSALCDCDANLNLWAAHV